MDNKNSSNLYVDNKNSSIHNNSKSLYCDLTLQRREAMQEVYIEVRLVRLILSTSHTHRERERQRERERERETERERERERERESLRVCHSS